MKKVSFNDLDAAKVAQLAKLAAEALATPSDVALDEAEKPLVDAVITWAETVAPVPVRVALDIFTPQIESAIFAVTNVITKDFMHTGKTMLLYLDKHLVENMHPVVVRAALAAKLLEHEGLSVIESALQYMHITDAKVIK